MAILLWAALLASSVAAGPVANTAVRSNLVEGSIFSRDFIARESRAPRTIVFDLDGTLGRMAPKGESYVIREGAVAQVEKLQAQGQRLALWTVQTRDGVEVLAQSRPDLLPRFDVVITGENFVPQSLAGYDDPEFRDAYRNAPQAKVDAFYMMGVAKDLSLFDGRRSGRGYAVIVDDFEDLARAAPDAPYGPFSVHPIKPFLEGKPDQEPLSRLAREVRRLARLSRFRDPPGR
jgi:hypothetical protein